MDTHSFEEVSRLQDTILEDYVSDFAKHAPKTDIPKLEWIWDCIPKQLARDNNKFVFSHVKEGKRASELEDALEWLTDAGLVHRLEMVSNPELPLSFYADSTFFKVYMADVGLLRRKSGLSHKAVLVEAKANISTRAKSYIQFCKKYRPPLGFKFSMKNVGNHKVENTLTYSVPLYMIWKLEHYLESFD